MTRYWLFKSEPETYSFDQLLQDRKTNWNGVRNFQARNFLKLVKKGDLALIYHSGKDKSVVGVASVVQEAYPDPEPGDKTEWVQVDVRPEHALTSPVPLSAIKKDSELSKILLVKQSRLSVMPLEPQHFKQILELSKQAGTSPA